VVATAWLMNRCLRLKQRVSSETQCGIPKIKGLRVFKSLSQNQCMKCDRAGVPTNRYACHNTSPASTVRESMRTHP
jgi:hypothetical protein